MNRSADETRLVQQELHVCPACGASNTLDMLSRKEYRCKQCNLELAHLDIAANGIIRGIFGWLHGKGDIIENRYSINSVLGKGGFGATYLVDDIRLSGKRRALKEVPELLFDEYETTLLSQLNHPAIPDIIDRCIVDGMVYLVLEFGGSQTLGSERKQYQGRIPQDKLLPWMRQLCEVLIYLHSQNPPIIHRDLKPDNILLDENGRIMLIDFGIAKEAKPATMTRTIGRAATHGFSPPEQAMGTGTDERSDIYALAATFYALLTGKNPPAAHERVAGKEIIPPSQIVPDISPLLETTLLQALSLNVNHRQQTVKEFNQTLEMIATGGHDPVTHTTEYTERTVMVGKTNTVTNTGGLHPASIKLPSGKISIAKSTPLSKSTPLPQATGAQQASNRNAIILIVGIVVFAAILTAGYLFWPKTVPEEKPPVATLTPPDKTGTVEPTTGSTTTPTVETTTEVKKPETTTGSTVPTVETKPQVATTVTPTPATTPTTGTSSDAKKSTGVTTSALEELTKRQSSQDVPKSSSTNIEAQDNRAAEEAKRRAREDARRRADSERKRQQAIATTNTRRTEQPARPQRTAPPEKSWADELKSSVTIVK